MLFSSTLNNTMTCFLITNATVDPTSLCWLILPSKIKLSSSKLSTKNSPKHNNTWTITCFKKLTFIFILWTLIPCESTCWMVREKCWRNWVYFLLRLPNKGVLSSKSGWPDQLKIWLGSSSGLNNLLSSSKSSTELGTPSTRNVNKLAF